MKSLVLLSGGIDSAACVQFYRSQNFQVETLFVDFGQPAGKAERRSARAISDFFNVAMNTVECSGPRHSFSGEIMGRNAFLVMTAMVYRPELNGLVCLGIHAGTGYYDCNTRFVELMSQLVDEYSNGRIVLGLPFLSWSKGMIWQYSAREKIPTDLTWSCETNSEQYCGICLSCRDREALNAGSTK